jgi:hypothetical protein
MKNMTIKVSSEVDQAIENYQTARRKLDGKITGKHRLVPELLDQLTKQIDNLTAKLEKQAAKQ